MPKTTPEGPILRIPLLTPPARLPPAQALYSIVGFSMCGMGLTSRQRYDRDAGQLLPTLFRGATNSNTNGSYSTSAAPYPGDPVIPAANLAYLDMSGG